MPHQCTTCGRTFGDGSKEMLSGCPDCGGNKFQFLPADAVDDGSGAAGGATAGGGVASGGATAGGTAPKKTPKSSSASARTRDAPETGGDADGSPSGAVDRAAATVREWVSARGDSGDADGSDPSASGRTDDGRAGKTDIAEVGRDGTENTAQASARRDVVSREELPDASERHSPVEASEAGNASAAAESEPSPDSVEAPSDSADAPPDSADAPPDSAEVSSAAAEASADENVVNAPDDRNPGLDDLRKELNDQFESIRIVDPGKYELNLMELYEREEYIISLQEDGKYVIEVPDAWERTERE